MITIDVWSYLAFPIRFQLDNHTYKFYVIQDDKGKSKGKPNKKEQAELFERSRASKNVATYSLQCESFLEGNKNYFSFCNGEIYLRDELKVT